MLLFLGDFILNNLKDKIVGIAGAGGLGSNCAVALARAGLKNLIIADFDVVAKSNLNRQYYFNDQVGKKKVFALKKNIFRINPKINVLAHDVKLNAKNIVTIFKSCDIVIEAFDLASMKKMLIEIMITDMPEKYLIIGCGLAGWGDNNSIKTRKMGNIYICGDEKSEVSKHMLPYAPRVGIVANMQANQAMELLLNE